MGVVVLALCLIFGVPLAPLAALWATITDLIPQIGALVATPLVGAIKQLYLQLRWGQQPFESHRPKLRDRLAKKFKRKKRQAEVAD